jgi:high frequency lysogenization protein
MSAATGRSVLERHGSAAALAGLVQATVTVHAIAHGQPVDAAQKAALIRAIFATNPDSLDDIFPTLAPYREGFRMAATMLASPASAAIEPLKYSIVLLDLEKRLRAQPALVQQIGQGIDKLAQREPDWLAAGAYSASSSGSNSGSGSESIEVPEHVYRELSELYQQTVSTLSRRVQVTGDIAQLRRDDIAAEVRALLLAGIRFAWLWRQLGGRRWHLVLRRSNIRHALAELDRHAAAVPLH